MSTQLGQGGGRLFWGLSVVAWPPFVESIKVCQLDAASLELRTTKWQAFELEWMSLIDLIQRLRCQHVSSAWGSMHGLRYLTQNEFQYLIWSQLKIQIESSPHRNLLIRGLDKASYPTSTHHRQDKLFINTINCIHISNLIRAERIQFLTWTSRLLHPKG